MSCVMYYRLGFDAHIIHLHYKMFKLGEKSVKQRERSVTASFQHTDSSRLGLKSLIKHRLK